MKAAIENIKNNQLKAQRYSDGFAPSGSENNQPYSEGKTEKHTSRIIEAIMLLCLTAVLVFVAVKIINKIP